MNPETNSAEPDALAATPSEPCPRKPDLPQIEFQVASRSGQETRLVIATFGDDGEHRSKLNTDSAVSRERFLRQVAKKVDTDVEALIAKYDRKITQLADD